MDLILDHLGRILCRSWPILGRCGVDLGPLGLSCCHVGPILAHLGRILGRSSAIWGHSCRVKAVLNVKWIGKPGAPVEAIRSFPLLGPAWVNLGPPCRGLGPCWADLGPSWADLAPPSADLRHALIARCCLALSLLHCVGRSMLFNHFPNFVRCWGSYCLRCTYFFNSAI